MATGVTEVVNVVEDGIADDDAEPFHAPVDVTPFSVELQLPAMVRPVVAIVPENVIEPTEAILILLQTIVPVTGPLPAPETVTLPDNEGPITNWADQVPLVSGGAGFVQVPTQVPLISGGQI